MTQLRYMSARDLANQRSLSDERRAWMLHQVATGELVIRQATPEERSRYRIAEPAVAARRARGRQSPGAPARAASARRRSAAGQRGHGRADRGRRAAPASGVARDAPLRAEDLVTFETSSPSRQGSDRTPGRRRRDSRDGDSAGRPAEWVFRPRPPLSASRPR